MELTVVFIEFPEGCAAFVKDLPGANTQGATLEKTRAEHVVLGGPQRGL